MSLVHAPLASKVTKHTEERLVSPATTSDDSNHSTDRALDDLLGARGKSNAGLTLVGVVANNCDVVARSPAKRTTISHLLLDVADNGTLGHGSKRKDISNSQTCVLSGVDELTGVHAFVGDEGLLMKLESVGVTEDNVGERCTTAGVVNDSLHNT